MTHPLRFVSITLALCALSVIAFFTFGPVCGNNVCEAGESQTCAYDCIGGGGSGSIGAVLMGMYDSVDTADYAYQWNDTHLTDLSTRGFKLILNYNTLTVHKTTLRDVLAYADLAHSKGMKVIWELRLGKDDAIWGSGTTLVNRFAPLARDVGATTDEQLMTGFVNAVKNHPATYGYYMGDEPRQDAYFELVKHNAGIVKAADPNHPTIVVYGWWMTSDDWLNKLLSPNIDMFGMDYYPLDPESAAAVAEGDSKMPERVKSMYEWTVRNDKKFFMVPQAFSFESYKCHVIPNSWPTEAQMREWRDIMLANSKPAFLLWYSYFDAIKDDCSWSRPTNFMDQVQAAASK